MPAAFVLVMVTDPRSTLWSSTVASAIVPPVASVITPDIEAVSACPLMREARLNRIALNKQDVLKKERKDIRARPPGYFGMPASLSKFAHLSVNLLQQSSA